MKTREGKGQIFCDTAPALEVPFCAAPPYPHDSYGPTNLCSQTYIESAFNAASTKEVVVCFPPKPLPEP